MTSTAIRKVFEGVAERRQMFRMFDRHAQRPNRFKDDAGAVRSTPRRFRLSVDGTPGGLRRAAISSWLALWPRTPSHRAARLSCGFGS